MSCPGNECAALIKLTAGLALLGCILIFLFLCQEPLNNHHLDSAPISRPFTED